MDNAKHQPVGAVDFPCSSGPSPTRLHVIIMPWRMKVTLRTLTTIETIVRSYAECDRLRDAIEADAARSVWRRPFYTWRIAGEPRDIMFRLADVLTVVNEPVEA